MKGEDKTATAKGIDLNMSPKNANEVCHAIRDMKTSRAVKYLENVLEKKEFVIYRRYTKKVAHRKGGKTGGFPQKASKFVLKVLKNAIKNAEFKGLDTDKLKVIHATAYKTMTLDRIKPQGRAHPHRIDLATVEIGVKEYD